MQSPPAGLFTRESVASAPRSIVGDIKRWSELQEGVYFLQSSYGLVPASANEHSHSIMSRCFNLIDSNPSVALLITKICQDPTVRLQETLQRFEQQIDCLASEIPMASLEHYPITRDTVIRTGSTGTVSSFMLGQLLNDPQVAHIYCLNWSTGSESLQRTGNLKRGIHTTLDAARMTFLDSLSCTVILRPGHLYIE